MANRQYNYAVCIDALEITYTATDAQKDFLNSIQKKLYVGEDSKSLWVERIESRHYRDEFIIKCADVDNNGYDTVKVVGYLRSGSFNPNRQKVYLTFENAALYSWILQTRFYVESALGLAFHRISKIDIAVDFDFNIQKRLITLLKSTPHDIIVNGRVANRKSVKGLNVHAYDINLDRMFAHPELTVSNDDSTLSMKTYNKRKEIENESGKSYITECTGFTGTHYRFEVTCKNYKRLFPSLKALGIDDTYFYIHLDNDETLKALFCDLLNRLIYLRKGRKQINIIDEILNGLK
ncbi:hypothetical protein [Bacteroides acidifaciens]|uniref:hypothetical protein n=1 Tax=Bacteroides acidifaciens TaxID=85831 RepID=UPI0025AE75A8|nr:hypothetical protein [Bacteroides acidifaciens]